VSELCPIGNGRARLHREGRSQDAKALLAPIYAECVEERDTPQLKEAASLLSQL